MVLVVSLVPQAVEACLKNLDRTNPAKGTEKVAKEGTKETFTLISHKGLGLEHLPRHYIKWHGVCHPPRKDPPRNDHPRNDHPTGEAEKAKKGLWDPLSWLFEGGDEPANLEKDEYMLVRLPPYYKVKWNLKLEGEETEIQETKYNNKLTWKEEIIEKIKVGFN